MDLETAITTIQSWRKGLDTTAKDIKRTWPHSIVKPFIDKIELYDEVLALLEEIE
jgi:hypothetical protein